LLVECVRRDVRRFEIMLQHFLLVIPSRSVLVFNEYLQMTRRACFFYFLQDISANGSTKHPGKPRARSRSGC
jgi:hypothetical protein